MYVVHNKGNVLCPVLSSLFCMLESGLKILQWLCYGYVQKGEAAAALFSGMVSKWNNEMHAWDLKVTTASVLALMLKR